VDIVYIGKVIKAHGLKGRIVVFAYAEDLKSFTPGRKVLIGSENDYRECTIRKIEGNSRSLKVELEDVKDRNEAESFVSRQIFIEQKQLDELPENQYYVFELIGCSVKTRDGTLLGVVDDVATNPGNDLLQVKKHGRIFFIPVVKEIVKDINLQEREIVVENIEGLFE